MIGHYFIEELKLQWMRDYSPYAIDALHSTILS